MDRAPLKRRLGQVVANCPDQPGVIIAIEVEVPRTREGGSPVDVIGRYRRRTAEIDEAIVSTYVHGASTCDAGQIAEALTGEQVGRSTVSRVTRSLNERVEELRKAPVAGPIPTSDTNRRCSPSRSTQTARGPFLGGHLGADSCE